MLSRREVIAAAGLAAVSRTALCGVPYLRPGSARDPSFVYAVIYDDRFRESVGFGAQARRLGYCTRAVSGDITALWYDDLYHRWKKGPAAIAGLTTREVAMCLRLFAADAGLRCVLEAEHRFRPDQTVVEHRIRAPLDSSSFTVLEECGECWPELMAELIGTCPIAPARLESAVVSRATATTAEGSPRLVSWIFAPLTRA